MSLYELPTRYDLPNYEYSIELDAVVYNVEYYFNQRDDRWFMSIRQEDGTAVLLGIPIVSGIFLTDRFVMNELPPGDLIPMDFEGGIEYPRRGDLSEGVQVIYNELST
jgi:hypothetical protein